MGLVRWNGLGMGKGGFDDGDLGVSLAYLVGAAGMGV